MKEKDREKKPAAKRGTKCGKKTDGADMVSRADPSGSYTGVPLDKKARPVQDADDL